MKITKYPQSCLLLEKDGSRILIDPGNFVASKYVAEDFLPLDGVLVTHEHPDHADIGLLGALADAGLTIVTNESTASVLGDMSTQVVQDGEEMEMGGFNVKVHELPHCLMVDGSKGPQNTGFIFDGKFFHPGDGVYTTGVKVGAAAVPIAGPDVSPHDAYVFIESVEAKLVIPVHYDYFIADPEFFMQTVARFGGDVQVAPLQDGEAVDF